MKLSAKKKGEIYDLIHLEMRTLRLSIIDRYGYNNSLDYKIAQLEIPLAQMLIKLLDPTYKVN